MTDQFWFVVAIPHLSGIAVGAWAAWWLCGVRYERLRTAIKVFLDAYSALSPVHREQMRRAYERLQ